MRHRVPLLAFVVVAATAGAACSKKDATTAPVVVNNIVTFKATMSGANENPANTSAGTGTFTATLDTTTYAFTYDIVFSGLTTNVTLGHIHGPAATAQTNAGTTINFATLAGATFTVGATSGTAHGSTILNAGNQITATITGDSLRKLLFAGLTYANIHTTQNGGGEIRGTILKQ